MMALRRTPLAAQFPETTDSRITAEHLRSARPANEPFFDLKVHVCDEVEGSRR
jgi:hypothetical protein